MVETWIKKAYSFKDDEELNTLYNNKIAINFLLVWARFEVINFDGFLKFELIDKISEKIVSEKSTSIPLLDDYVKYFYERYNEPDKGQLKLRGLCFKMKKCRKKGCITPDCRTKKILDEELKELTPKDKVYFLIYIVSRYRNNMFHGNKNAQNWILQYEIPIEKCIQVMILLTKIDEKDLDEEEVDAGKNKSQEIINAIKVEEN